MKKLASVTFGLFFCIITLMLSFLCIPKSDTYAASESFYESDLEIVQDIISPSNNNFAAATASSVGTPFDPETNDCREGYLITPNTDEYNQVKGWSTSVSGFSITMDSSLFVWVYIPCNPELNGYSLTLEISNINKGISWTLTSSWLVNEMDEYNDSNKKGWCLFELSLEDADESVSAEDLNGTTFSIFRISYLASSFSDEGNTQEIPIKVSESKLSFYHLFIAKKTSSSASIIYKQNYVQYKFLDSYQNFDSWFYVGDKFEFKKENIFKYLIIGKYDLLNSNFTDFSFKIEVKNEDNQKSEKKFGDEYEFKAMGYYSITIIVNEKNFLIGNIQISDEVFRAQNNFRCEEFTLGSFVKTRYEMSVNETQVITFRYTSNYEELEGTLRVVVSNENYAEIKETKIVGDIIYITVEAKQAGKVNIMVESKGSRANTDVVETYSRTATIKIEDENSNSRWKTTFMWVVLGVYGVIFVSILVISVVKNKRNGVK